MSIVVGADQGGAGGGAVPPGEVDIMRPSDIDSISRVRSEAFAEKACWALGETKQDAERDNKKAYTTKCPPTKMAHCGVVRDEQGRCLAGCQLQMGDDPGDGIMPDWMQHHVKPGECYVEWIGTLDEARGRGMGSKLMKWADETARKNGCSRMTLDVMGSNRAVALYERQGYEAMPYSHSGCCMNSCLCCIVYCFMGCHYCKVIHMEKKL
mmetsp:Transcript_568/g.1482  ORF Transcript_568/g.1482 Transcript_568/m.1482 type:complete len:210 (-) Transcript_568:304-933(-)